MVNRWVLTGYFCDLAMRKRTTNINVYGPLDDDDEDDLYYFLKDANAANTRTWIMIQGNRDFISFIPHLFQENFMQFLVSVFYAFNVTCDKKQ